MMGMRSLTALLPADNIRLTFSGMFLLEAADTELQIFSSLEADFNILSSVGDTEVERGLR